MLRASDAPAISALSAMFSKIKDCSAMLRTCPRTYDEGKNLGSEPNVLTPEKQEKAHWLVSATSLFFILLQSVCTAVVAISGIRVVIGSSALLAALGLGRPATGFHQDAIRIPMMFIAVLLSAINLYVIRRIRSLRRRPAAQWRVTLPTPRQIRSERLQIMLAVITFMLVVAEWMTHRIVHKV